MAADSWKAAGRATRDFEELMRTKAVADGRGFFVFFAPVHD